MKAIFFCIIATLVLSLNAEARSTTIIYTVSSPYMVYSKRELQVDIEYRKNAKPVLRWIFLCDGDDELIMCKTREENISTVKGFDQISKTAYVITFDSGKTITIDNKNTSIEVSGLIDQTYTPDTARFSADHYVPLLTTKHALLGSYKLLPYGGLQTGWVAGEKHLQVNLPLQSK